MHDLRLLEEAAEKRRREREALRLATRARLKTVLGAVFPAGFPVIIFGSLCRENGFSSSSDVDIAVENFPGTATLTELTAALSEKLSRDVDVVLLPQSRFATAIRRTGETWTA